MKGKFLKKALAAALVLTFVSGGTPASLFSQVFGDVTITANAEWDDPDDQGDPGE